MFTQRTFWSRPIHVVVTTLWLGLGLVACNATSDSPPTTANEQTVKVELPVQDSREPDNNSDSVVDERQEEEIISMEKEESPPTEAETKPESTMSITNPEEGVGFQTIAHGDSLIAELTLPTILVAGSSEEASQFSALFDDVEVGRQIERVDFGTKWLVLVSSGVAGSSGYGISVEVVEPIDGEVRLHVQQSEPNPDSAVSAVITYPYHLIEINRSDLQLGSIGLWKLYDLEGSLLTEVSYP